MGSKTRWFQSFTLSAMGAAGTLLALAGAVLAAPLVQILSPQSGTKLRQGQHVAVEATILGLEHGGAWTATIEGPGDPVTLAKGTDELDGEVVGEIESSTLIPGHLYQLHVHANAGEATAVATSTLIVPDNAFTIIPVRDGGPTTKGKAVYAVDDTGNVLYSSASGDPEPLTIIRYMTPERETFRVSLANTTGVKFSGDGERLFFVGHFSSTGLGYLDLSSGSQRLIDTFGGIYFRVDKTGARVAYQAAVARVDPAKINRQYFLFDETTREYRQLTEKPGAIDRNSLCPSPSGSTPQISADGSTIVFLTPATLGIVPEDPAVGCRVFAYDVETQELRQVAALPSTWLKANYPSLSGDGRWLSFPVVETRPTGGSRGMPVLVDVQTGEVTAPIIDTGDFTNFDSTITRDGSAIIISSQADLDRRVGNADHNLELFYLERATGDIRQITETVGGIGSSPGGCETYRVSANSDGSVMVFGMVAIDVLGCRLDGPQRVERNGLWLGRVRAVRKRPGNHEVMFERVEDPRIVIGEAIDITFRAEDADGDLISFYAQVPGTRDIIPGSWFKDNFDGTASFEWQPRPEDVGTHVLRVAAFDEGGGEVVQDVTFTVLPTDDGEAACAGACTEPKRVGVNDVVTLVNIALGFVPTEECPPGDIDGDGSITVDEIQTALGNALEGCG